MGFRFNEDMKIKQIIISIAIIFSSPLYAQQLKGVVHKISDGDTFVLRTDSGRYRIRLYAIDAPELKQDFGTESKEYLQYLIANDSVFVNVADIDRYDRIIGSVSTRQYTDISLQMICSGMAWHYLYFDKTKQYIDAEKMARKKKLGLWVDDAPINPYIFRSKN